MMLGIEMKCYCGRELEAHPFGMLLCPKCKKVSVDCKCSPQTIREHALDTIRKEKVE